MKKALPTIENYKAVAKACQNRQIIALGLGWAAGTNGFGIDPENVNEEFQEQYYQELMAWAEKEQVTVYYFEMAGETGRLK